MDHAEQTPTRRPMLGMTDLASSMLVWYAHIPNPIGEVKDFIHDPFRMLSQRSLMSFLQE